jgi:hypothetical protein
LEQKNHEDEDDEGLKQMNHGFNHGFSLVPNDFGDGKPAGKTMAVMHGFNTSLDLR